MSNYLISIENNKIDVYKTIYTFKHIFYTPDSFKDWEMNFCCLILFFIKKIASRLNSSTNGNSLLSHFENKTFKILLMKLISFPKNNFKKFIYFLERIKILWPTISLAICNLIWPLAVKFGCREPIKAKFRIVQKIIHLQLWVLNEHLLQHY